MPYNLISVLKVCEPSTIKITKFRICTFFAMQFIECEGNWGKFYTVGKRELSGVFESKVQRGKIV